MMIAAMAFADERGHVLTPRVGIIWGLAGFIAVHFAPAIGLPPELPGSSAADVGARQDLVVRNSRRNGVGVMVDCIWDVR